MTLLLHSSPLTKKALKEHCSKGTTEGIILLDPSVFNPIRGGRPFCLNDLPVGHQIAVCLDHPKRRTFASIERSGDTFKIT